MPPSPEVSTPVSAPLRVGYVIPEFPGQTHVWMWREIVHLREAGAEVHLFSTRRPTERDRARHGFADAVRAETTYLWPMSLGQILGDVTRAKLRHPLAWLKAVRLAATLPVDDGPAVKTVLPLLVPACRLAREVQRRGITHLHSHTCANSAILCMLVRELTCVPYSMTLNANVEWWGGAMAEKFGRAQFTVAITEWLERQVREQFPSLRDDQLILGRIGVDTVKWRPAKSLSETSDDRLNVISVGRLHPSKGYDVLLEALKQLDDRGVAFDLTLIGDGPQRVELEAEAETLGLADRATFTGSLGEDEIIGHMQTADVFVLSSHAEPLGVVTMEAMAMGVAAVATDAGGVGEIVTDGVDGLLVPPKDAAAMASALQQLAEDPKLRRRLAAAGRRTIVERFDSRRGAATLFEKLTGRRPDAMLSVLDGVDPAAPAPAEREVA